MLREAIGCFIGRWTEILDGAVSRGWCKLTLNHSAFLVACRRRGTYREDQRDATSHSL